MATNPPYQNEPSPPPHQPAVRPPFFSAGPWVFPFIACFSLLLLFSAKKISSYDLGTHLRSGQWIVQNMAFPAKDTFTYTQTSRDYLDPNGLYQVLLYLLEEHFGYASLTVLNILVLILVFALLYRRLQISSASPGWTCLLMLVCLLIIERRFTVRPEVFSWLFLGLTLLVLDLRWRRRDVLYLLPLIQLFWVNMEGLFVLGWIGMSAYLLSGRLHQKRWDPKLVRYSLLSLAADFLNPYFAKGVAYPFILWTRLQGSNLHKQTIIELQSPWQFLKTQNLHYDSNTHVFLFFLSAALCVLLVFLTLKQRKLHEFLLLAAFGYMACAAVRNIPLFALVVAPILASTVRNLPAWPGGNARIMKVSPYLAAIFILLLCLRVATNAFYVFDRRLDRVGLGLDANCLPVKATEFLRENHLNGRILNELDFGGWLDWQGPQPTFIDGRSEVVEDEFYRRYQQSFNPMGLMTLMVNYQPELIMVNYNAGTEWVDQLRHFSNWRLIYLDECAAIYAAKDYANEWPPLSFQLLLSQRNMPISSEETVWEAVQAAPPAKWKSWFEGFFRPQTYPMGTFCLGLFALRQGEYGVSQNLFLEGFRQTGSGFDEVYYNLGVASLHLEQYRLGRLCLEDVLQLKPGDAPCKQILKSLPPP